MVRDKTFRQHRFEADEVAGQQFERCLFLACDFSWLDLRECRFVDCRFYDREEELTCQLQGCDLREASFLRCDLTLANLSRSECLGLEMRDCQAMGIDLSQASFANRITPSSYFCEAYLTGNNFSFANLASCLLERCELHGNRWQNANLSGTSLAGSDLRDGEFGQFDWQGVILSGCDLRGCDLPGLDLRRVDLSGVQICESQQQALLETIGLQIFP